jgi:glyoxylase-like metal-dependent hydrolase (beta-lactamase superfamily II)
MPRLTVFLAPSLLLLTSAAVSGQTSAAAPGETVVRTADPAKRGLHESDFPRTVKVADNVYTYEDFHAGPEKFTTTDLFVVTDEGVLVADGQGSLAETKGLVDAIARVTTQPIKYVVICSDHGDHTAGNAAFPAGVRYLIHPTSKAILARGNGWKPPVDAELVDGHKALRLGREDIQVLFLGRAHTGGDLSVFLPARRILFLSETYLNRVFPAMRSAYPSEWLRALDRAEAMKADIYIAGHGFTETGPVSREEIAAYHKSLEAVVAEATRLHAAGVPVDEAIRNANWGEYASWTLASSQGPIAVRRVYDELDGKLR